MLHVLIYKKQLNMNQCLLHLGRDKLATTDKLMSIGKITSKSLVAVEMDDSLKVVKNIFDNTRFHHLLVVESGKLYGVISDRDLLKALSPNIGTIAETLKDSATLNKKVHQIMTRKPITLTSDAGVNEAIESFNQHDISCLPVVNDKLQPIGIISWRDILKAIESNPNIIV